MNNHALIRTLKNLEGNPRASVLTEPMWGIPFNLFIPYASVYMLNLGLSDAQIGGIASLGLVAQTFFALISGAVTDRLGRRLTTLIFDLLSWGIPCLIWAFAQDIRFFAAAALFNAAWRVPANSWVCLLVEDAKEDELVHIWTLIHIAGLLSAFFAPLAGLLINAFSLVTAVRLLYFFAFVMMTSKAFILYKYSTETAQGIIRRQETQHMPILSILGEYKGVGKQIIKNKQVIMVGGIMLVLSIVNLVNGSFWSIFVTEKLGIPDKHLALYPFARSVLMLGMYFWVVPRLNVHRFYMPMLAGFAGFFTAALLLVIIPGQNYGLLLVSVLIDACSIAIFTPVMDSLTVISIPAAERARINAILAVIVIICTSPFGWIAGQLSEINRVYPFLVNIALFAIGAFLVHQVQQQRKQAAALAAAA